MKDRIAKIGIAVKMLGVIPVGAGLYFFTHTAQGANQLYYVEDLLAALLLFSIAFILVAVIILILFLLDQGSNRFLACIRLYVVRAALRLHRGCLHVLQLRKQYFHGPDYRITR
jgi:hypothetical protein